MDSTTSAPSLEELAGRLKSLESERDEYKQLYVSMVEAYRKLEAGLAGQKRERFVEGGEQTTLELLSMLTGQAEPAAPNASTQVEAHRRVKPTGRKPLPDSLPRIHVEVLPPDVQRAGG